MKSKNIPIMLFLFSIAFYSCDENKKLKQECAEETIKEFVSSNSFIAGSWQQGAFSVGSILSIEQVSQFTETEASAVVHFDFQDSYTDSKLTLRFKFRKDINKKWFLTGIEPISGVGSQSILDILKKWNNLNIMVKCSKPKDENIIIVQRSSDVNQSNTNKSIKVDLQKMNREGFGEVTFFKNDQLILYFVNESNTGEIIINGEKYKIEKCTMNENAYLLTGKGLEITAKNLSLIDQGDCFHYTCPSLKVTLNGASTTIDNVDIQDCLTFSW